MGYLKEHKESFSARGKISFQFPYHVFLLQSPPPFLPWGLQIVSPRGFFPGPASDFKAGRVHPGSQGFLECASEEGKKPLEADQGFLFPKEGEGARRAEK